jgi:hypothetical protein
LGSRCLVDDSAGGGLAVIAVPDNRRWRSYVFDMFGTQSLSVGVLSCVDGWLEVQHSCSEELRGQL